MRGLGKAIAALAAGLIATSAAAQATNLPKAPVPYTKIRPPQKARPAAARPATASPAATATATAAATPAAPPRTINGARLAIGQPMTAADLAAYVDGWMTDAMAREHVVGATVSIVQNGQVVLNKGYGFADLSPRRPVDPDRTLFRLGSISKTFTWILLMREVEAGRMRLSAPVNLYLGERTRLPGRLREVTVRNLMDHSLGVEDRALGQLFEDNPRRIRPLDLYLRQERPQRVRAPAVLASYSNYGAALAGAAVATGKGKTFERVVEDEIIVPLGLTHTTFREPRAERRGLPAAMPERLRADIARGYGWQHAGFQPHAYEFIGQVAPAGSASSTAGDMARYMLMLLGDGATDGRTIFGPQAARAFRTPLLRTPAAVNGWAHGFMMYDLPGGFRGYGHGGDTIAFHSNLVVVPELNLGVFISTNSEGGGALAGALPDSVIRYFYAPPATFPRLGGADLSDAADLFEGAYLSTRRAKGGLEGFVGLVAGATTVSVTPGGRLVTEGLNGSQAWVPEGPARDGRFISTTSDRRLIFRMADGRAQSFQTWANVDTVERAAVSKRISTLVIAAVLTGFAAVATILGLMLRGRREVRQNQIQARAALVQTMQAGLWIATFVLFGLWAARASDIQVIMYNWPGALLITASACALVAAALSLMTIAALPAVWQGGRRVDSWTASRKVFFTLTVLIYSGFSFLLAYNGALEPWSR